MNILEEIIAHKKIEVAGRKIALPAAALEKRVFFSRPTVSLRGYIRRGDKTGIIAEFKRRSPSKGVINAHAPVAETTAGYAAAGASGLSVLTDEKFFGGTGEDLVAARQANVCPILRKDFMIDEYQVIEARSLGADVILLIAAVLTPAAARRLATLAHALQMEVLLEVHDEHELAAHLDSGADVIGVNNRNLKTFEVSLNVSKELAAKIPDAFVKISESGISDQKAIMELRKYGFEGFLMGENFMKHERPEIAAQEFMSSLMKEDKRPRQ